MRIALLCRSNTHTKSDTRVQCTEADLKGLFVKDVDKSFSEGLQTKSENARRCRTATAILWMRREASDGNGKPFVPSRFSTSVDLRKNRSAP